MAGYLFLHGHQHANHVAGCPVEKALADHTQRNLPQGGPVEPSLDQFVEDRQEELEVGPEVVLDEFPTGFGGVEYFTEHQAGLPQGLI